MWESTSLQLRRQLVDSLRAKGILKTTAIADAFLEVRRDMFVPEHSLEDVYRDQAITTKEQSGVPISSSSQPTMMAIMLEQLELQPGMRVLEIGAGTGYNAALLQSLVGPTGHVTSVEIDSEIASWARARLHAAGNDKIQVVQADGSNGWPAGAPYDRIELTVGTADIAAAWFDQLTPGGILVVPLWINSVQLCVAFAKRDEMLLSRSAMPCGFTRIRGRMAGIDQYRTLQPGVMIAGGDRELSDDVLRQLISQRSRSESMESASWHGFALYMAVHDSHTVMLASTDERIMGFDGPAFGLCDPTHESLCLLSYPVEGNGVGTIHSYGEESARMLVGSLLDRWRADGSPDLTGVGVVVLPTGTPVLENSSNVVVDSDRWRFVFGFGHENRWGKGPAT